MEDVGGWREEWTPPFVDEYELHPWQKTGVAFLLRCREKFGVALLADDMEVGKVWLRKRVG